MGMSERTLAVRKTMTAQFHPRRVDVFAGGTRSGTAPSTRGITQQNVSATLLSSSALQHLGGVAKGTTGFYCDIKNVSILKNSLSSTDQ